MCPHVQLCCVPLIPVPCVYCVCYAYAEAIASTQLRIAYNCNLSTHGRTWQNYRQSIVHKVHRKFDAVKSGTSTEPWNDDKDCKRT
jgi:hypothetical protein